MTNYDSVQNKSSATTRKLHFYEGKHAFISIDKSIVDALNLGESDLFSEEVTSDGILLRRQGKESPN